MPMRTQIAVLLLILSNSVQALTCTNYVPPNGEKIELETEAGVTYFSVPAKLEGQDLQSVTLWAYPIRKSTSGELAAPLQFKVVKGVAKGHFAITAPFLNAEITAAYTKDLCGPSLAASVNI
jgi:hypothetical protein